MAARSDGPPPTTDRERAAPGTPLYVHLPFCAAKCHYCDFFSVPWEGQDRGAVMHAILAEARAWAPHAPRTVFVGGGTPSFHDEQELRLLFDGLDEITGFRSSAAEVTVECNPESLDAAKARLFVALGATRLSIGIQALDDRALRLFGRVHDAAAGPRAYDAARSAGPRAVSVDLIYAWPGQELEAWLADLERVLALGPDHVSAYNLTFEEDTLFARWMDDGVLEPQAEELELAFFGATRERLSQAGLPPYEVSNFSASGSQCLHNVNYWRNGAYVGLGPSAVSKVGLRRFGNPRSIREYLRGIQRAADARAWEESPGPERRLGESWWLGLRLAAGISPAEARARAAAADAPDRGLEVARRLELEGLLGRDGERFHLTPRGWPLADWVGREFLGAADRLASAEQDGVRA
jgi:oxygen-independent coproporphyrinogen-3 oxidase